MLIEAANVIRAAAPSIRRVAIYNPSFSIRVQYCLGFVVAASVGKTEMSAVLWCQGSEMLASDLSDLVPKSIE